MFASTPLKGKTPSFFFRFRLNSPHGLTPSVDSNLLTSYRPIVRSHFSVNQHWRDASIQPFNLNSQNLSSLATQSTPVVTSFYQTLSKDNATLHLFGPERSSDFTVLNALTIQFALLLPFLQESLTKSFFLQEACLSQQTFLLPERQHFYAYSNRKLYRRSLQHINLLSKRVNRKFRTFATHLIKPHLHDNLVWGEVIPELPLALRGSFSINKSSPGKVAISYLHSFPSKSISGAPIPDSLPRKRCTGSWTPSHQSLFSQTTLPPYTTKHLLVNSTGRLRKLAPRVTALKLGATVAKRVFNKRFLFLIKRLKRRFRRIKLSKRNVKVLISPFSRQITPQFKLWLKSTLTSLRHGNYTTRRRNFTANQLLTRKVSQALKRARQTLLSKAKINVITPLVTPKLSDTSSYAKQLNLPRIRLLTCPSTPFKSPNSLFLTSHTNFWSNPVLLKYYFWQVSLRRTGPSLRSVPSLLELLSWVKRAQHSLSTLSFENQLSNIRSSNLWLSSSSHFTIRKTLLRLSSFTPFHGQVSLWYYKTLILFMENITGRKVFLNFGAFIEDALTFEDKALCSIWAPRVLGFQRMLGHRIFLKESMIVIATAIRLKDPTFLANWIRAMLYRMSFWKYRLLFRYLRFVLRHLINYSFEHFQIRGIKLQLKGKISVAGNARTRTLVQRVGDTSHSKMSNRVAYDLSFVNSFTGVMGFKLWFFY